MGATKHSFISRWAPRVGGSFIATYLLYLLFLFCIQRVMVFPGAFIERSEAGRPSGGEQVVLPVGRAEVPATFMATSTVARAPAVLLAHGNGETIGDLVPFASVATKHGMSVLLVEFPGFGAASGAPSRSAIGAAFDAGYEWLVEDPRVDPHRILFVGRSLGGAVMCELTARHPSVGLVTFSTFSRLAEMAKGYGFPSFLLRDPFDCPAALEDYEQLVLVFHGERDSLVPPAEAVRLVEAARNAELLWLDCVHNDCPPEPVVFWKTVYERFFDRPRDVE